MLPLWGKAFCIQHHCHFKTKHKCPQKLWHTFSHTPFGCSKLIRITFSLDLRKPCWITGKNLSSNLEKCFVLEEIDSYIISNRMRNMHLYIRSGIRNILFWQGRVLHNSLHNLGEFSPHSFSHLRWVEDPPMLGICGIIYLWGDLSDWTNYNFHACVQYCITIHYHSCIIDKYRNVDGPKWHNNGKVKNIPCFEKEWLLQKSP